MSDIDTEAVDSLKVLDPSWPIREATGLMRHSETTLSAKSRLMHRSKRRGYSITSSAMESNVGGTVRPSVFAVLRLITSSNFVGCWIGSSVGLAPFRIRPTY